MPSKDNPIRFTLTIGVFNEHMELVRTPWTSLQLEAESFEQLQRMMAHPERLDPHVPQEVHNPEYTLVVMGLNLCNGEKFAQQPESRTQKALAAEQLEETMLAEGSTPGG